ncbi:hypothetical protein Pta02_53640 [Planobispora takensis]|uniref:Uncharacterized protein n=1 Tax=Planobispora takensis TaxID=1367882 RepID=A0A8J3WV22_9ACTN|nr:hypothetical protein Pta02_53640 [Planobispora takensis]
MHETYQPQELNPEVIESPSAAMTTGRHGAAAVAGGAGATRVTVRATAPVNVVTVLRIMAPPVRDQL